MAFYDPMIYELHVLLVDGDVNYLQYTTLLLETNLYKVTAVDEITAASAVLCKGKVKFDLVMIDINSFNLEGYKLLHEAVTMDIPVILMSSNANATLVKCAIEDGAFLFMEKPFAVGELKYLWQHVLREKSRKKSNELNGKSGEAIITANHNQNCYVLGGGNLKDCSIPEGMAMNQYVATNKETCQKRRVECARCVNSQNGMSDPSMKNKVCTEWTPELHEKFMAAVSYLGEGRCFPKDILELMNVPGLTRMQVASHLQKCRYGWQPPHERNGRPFRASRSPIQDSDHPNRSKIKRYGSVPRMAQSCPPPPPPPSPLQLNEQAPIATSPMNLQINPTFFNNTNNINGEQGTLITTNHVANYTNMMMNGTLYGNGVVGNMMTEGLQSFDPTDQTTYDQSSRFWTWWVGEFAKDGNQRFE